MPDWVSRARSGLARTARSRVGSLEGRRLRNATAHIPPPRTRPASPAGYAVAAVARLDGVGFDIEPRGEWQKDLPARETVSWQWTLRPRERGKHSISASVALVWTAAPGTGLPARDRAQIYSRAREITVSDTLGLETTAATA